MQRTQASLFDVPGVANSVSYRVEPVQFIIDPAIKPTEMIASLQNFLLAVTMDIHVSQ